jgi:hypothetical protein
MVKKIAAFESAERTQLWRDLAEERRSQRPKSRRIQVRHLSQEVEELLAQFDFLRGELENVRKRLRAASSR